VEWSEWGEWSGVECEERVKCVCCLVKEYSSSEGKEMESIKCGVTGLGLCLCLVLGRGFGEGEGHCSWC
jgi:hypothetical protein